MPTSYQTPIAEIMSRPITAPATATVESLIELMRDRQVGCVPIVDSRSRPIGIVTKLDLIECQGEPRATAREVMMPHAMTVLADDTVAQAAALMSREGFHHLLVIDAYRTLVGVVSTLDITRWVAKAG